MLPQAVTEVADIQENMAEEPGNITYRLDLENKRIGGRISGLEAIRQSVMKSLFTYRYGHVIYTGEYGSEIEGLVGQEAEFAKTEMERRVKDALFTDKRIQAVTDFEVTTGAGGRLSAQFRVKSSEGEFIQEAKI